jgi:hypothetical protein
MTELIEYSLLPTESGIILVELNTQTMTFRKIINSNDIMEAKTRPKYNEFLKEWSEKNKITSFFGSDKKEFLQDWNNVKTGGTKAVPIIEPVEEPKIVNDLVNLLNKKMNPILKKEKTEEEKKQDFKLAMERHKAKKEAKKKEVQESIVEPVEEPIIEPEKKGTIKTISVGDVYKSPVDLKQYGKFVTIISITPKMVLLGYNITTIRDGKEIPVTLINKKNNKLLFKDLRTSRILKTSLIGRPVESVEEKDQSKWVQKSISSVNGFIL